MKLCQCGMRNVLLTWLAVSLLLARGAGAQQQTWNPSGTGYWQQQNLIRKSGSDRLIAAGGLNEHQSFLIFKLPQINDVDKTDPYHQLLEAAQRGQATNGIGGLITSRFFNDTLGRHVRNIRAYLELGSSVIDLAQAAQVDLVQKFKEYNKSYPSKKPPFFPVDNAYPYPTPTANGEIPIDLPVPGFDDGLARDEGHGSELWIKFPTRWGEGFSRDLDSANTFHAIAISQHNTANRDYTTKLIRLYNAFLHWKGVYTLRIDGEVWVPTGGE